MPNDFFNCGLLLSLHAHRSQIKNMRLQRLEKIRVHNHVHLIFLTQLFDQLVEVWVMNVADFRE